MLHIENFIEVDCISNNKTTTWDGGERGIRTLGTVARTRDFQSRTIGHSVTSPLQICPEKSKTFPEHKFYLR